MIQNTEARRDKGGEGRPAEEEGKGSTEPASIRKHSKERPEDGACADVTKDEGGGGTRVPSEECGKAPGALLKNTRHPWCY